MPLTDAKIRQAKAQDKPYKLSDGEGMFLLVHPNGGKYWRLKYRFGGHERILALGVYPEVDLREARDLRYQARKAMKAGQDPGALKQQVRRQQVVKSENTFEVVANEWREKMEHEWSPEYAATIKFRLNRHIFPKLGKRPVADINAPEVLAMLRITEKNGSIDLTQRLSAVCGQIFSYAIATGRADRNPVPDLRGALKSPVRKHRAYLNDDDLPKFMKRLAVFDGDKQTKLALNLIVLTFVRTVELRGAQWKEFDLDKAEWRIPAERMKMRTQHIVPLSSQAVEVLRELKEISGEGALVFPNRIKSEKCISENTLLYALYRMGYHSEATVHGFRSTASTILNENEFSPDVIERQLAHEQRNKVRAAYNHAQYLPERRKMMQWWADYLDKAAQKSVPADN